MEIGELHTVLERAVEAAKLPGAELAFDATTSAETESLCAILTVHFAKTGPQPSVSLTHLIEQMERSSVVGSTDIIGPPHNQIILQGAANETAYKVVFQL